MADRIDHNDQHVLAREVAERIERLAKDCVPSSIIFFRKPDSYYIDKIFELTLYGKDARYAVPFLIRILENESGPAFNVNEVFNAAEKALVSIGIGTKEALEKSASVFLRLDGCSYLRERVILEGDDETIPAEDTLSILENYVWRKESICTEDKFVDRFVKFGNASIPHLKRLLESDDWDAQSIALLALYRLNYSSDDIRPRLLELYKTRDDYGITLLIRPLAAALLSLEGDERYLPERIDFLIGKLFKGTAPEPWEAQKALSYLGPRAFDKIISNIGQYKNGIRENTTLVDVVAGYADQVEDKLIELLGEKNLTISGFAVTVFHKAAEQGVVKISDTALAVVYRFWTQHFNLERYNTVFYAEDLLVAGWKKSSVPLIVSGLKSADKSLLLASFKLLKRIGPATYDTSVYILNALKPFLDHPDQEIKASAIVTIGSFGSYRDAELMNRLLPVLEETNEDVLTALLAAFYNLGSPEDGGILLPLLENILLNSDSKLTNDHKIMMGNVKDRIEGSQL